MESTLPRWAPVPRLRCPCCHAVNEPALPPEAATCSGPNLTALVATLVGENRLSRDATAALLQTVLGIPIPLETDPPYWPQRGIFYVT